MEDTLIGIISSEKREEIGKLLSDWNSVIVWNDFNEMDLYGIFFC